jgi:type VI secretion system protein ImpE
LSDADTLFGAGDLLGARAALTETLKRAPADQPARLFLFQLLCVLGEWDKAEVQLRSLASLSPDAQMLAVTYSLAIQAEKERAAAFAGLQTPCLLVANHPWAGGLAAALAMQTRGEAGFQDRRSAALDAAPDTPGQIDGIAFDWIADADARFGPAFEAIVAGQWGLIPFDAVETVTSKGPHDLRDLVWLPAQVMFRTGQSVNALLPTRYPGINGDDNSDLKLARATDWRGVDGNIGQGARLWMLSGGEEIDLLALRSLRFEP